MKLPENLPLRDLIKKIKISQQQKSKAQIMYITWKTVSRRMKLTPKHVMIIGKNKF